MAVPETKANGDQSIYVISKKGKTGEYRSPPELTNHPRTVEKLLKASPLPAVVSFSSEVVPHVTWHSDDFKFAVPDGRTCVVEPPDGATHGILFDQSKGNMEKLAKAFAARHHCKLQLPPNGNLVMSEEELKYYLVDNAMAISVMRPRPGGFLAFRGTRLYTWYGIPVLPN